MPPERLHSVLDHLRTTHDELRRDGRHRVLLAVSAGWLLALGGRYLIPALLPRIRTTFQIDHRTAGVAVTIIWAAYALTQLPAGVLTDRIGERLLLATSLGSAAGSLLVLSVAPIFGVFLVGCAVFGLGTGLYGPARGTVVSNVFSERDGAAFGIVLAAGSLGSAGIPAVGGYLASHFGWRTTIAVGVPTFLVAGWIAWRHIPHRSTESSHPDHHRDHASRVRESLHDRRVLIAFGAITLMLFAFQGLAAFLTTYLVEQKGLGTTIAATLFALVFLSGAGFQLVAGSAADHYGQRPVLVVVSLVGALAVAGLPFVAGVIPVAILLGLVGARLAISPLSNAYVLDVLPEDVQGTSWGVLRTSYMLLASLGSTFVGALADRGHLEPTLFVLAGLMLVAAGLYALLPDRDQA